MYGPQEGAVMGLHDAQAPEACTLGKKVLNQKEAKQDSASRMTLLSASSPKKIRTNF